MSTIKISNSLIEPYTLLNNNFIDVYMKDADGTFVKIYLIILRNIHTPNSELSLEAIAKSLDILASDVLRGIKYWESKGLMKYIEDGDSTILELFEPKPLEPVVANFVEAPVANMSYTKKPVYVQEEIAIYQNNSNDIRELFNFAEEQFGRPLKYEDFNILLSIYDWLKMPLEVIYVLIQFCASSKYNLKYAEKVAISWHDKNIDTKDKALQILTAHDTSYRPVMKFMGLSTLAENQKKLIDKWVCTYGFNINVILKACEISVNAKGSNISFNYIDTILNEWYKNNVHSMEQIEKYREERTKKYKEKETKPVQNTNFPQKKNKFLNFPQTKYDFDELEQMEMKRAIERIKKAGIINELEQHN